jgi:TPR repeat protein
MNSLALATVLALPFTPAKLPVVQVQDKNIFHSSYLLKCYAYNEKLLEYNYTLASAEERKARAACSTSSNPRSCKQVAAQKKAAAIQAANQGSIANNGQCLRQSRYHHIFTPPAPNPNSDQVQFPKKVESWGGPYYHLVQHLLPRAQQGDVQAQLQLASVYRIGKGVPQDYGKALSWYRQAAAQGNAKAEDFIGRFYQYRWGVPQNYPKAVQWYSLAAKQGYPRGEVDLAWMYLHGLGTAPNYKLAYLLASDAYKHHNAKAADYLGNMYFSGEWVPRNIPLARRYWEIAFNWGYSDALMQLNMTRPLPVPSPHQAYNANSAHQQFLRNFVGTTNSWGGFIAPNCYLHHTC